MDFAERDLGRLCILVQDRYPKEIIIDKKIGEVRQFMKTGIGGILWICAPME